MRIKLAAGASVAGVVLLPLGTKATVVELFLHVDGATVISIDDAAGGGTGMAPIPFAGIGHITLPASKEGWGSTANGFKITSSNGVAVGGEIHFNQRQN